MTESKDHGLVSCGSSLTQGGVAHTQRQACSEDTRGCSRCPQLIALLSLCSMQTLRALLHGGWSDIVNQTRDAKCWDLEVCQTNVPMAGDLVRLAQADCKTPSDRLGLDEFVTDMLKNHEELDNGSMVLDNDDFDTDGKPVATGTAGKQELARIAHLLVIVQLATVVIDDGTFNLRACLLKMQLHLSSRNISETAVRGERAKAY